MARARATMGGPSLESRTPWSAASFQSRTTLSPEAKTSSGSPPKAGAAAARAPHLSAVRHVIRKASRSLIKSPSRRCEPSERRRQLSAGALQSLVDRYLTLEQDLMEGEG